MLIIKKELQKLKMLITVCKIQAKKSFLNFLLKEDNLDYTTIFAFKVEILPRKS